MNRTKRIRDYELVSHRPQVDIYTPESVFRLIHSLLSSTLVTLTSPWIQQVPWDDREEMEDTQSAVVKKCGLGYLYPRLPHPCGPSGPSWELVRPSWRCSVASATFEGRYPPEDAYYLITSRNSPHRLTNMAGNVGPRPSHALRHGRHLGEVS